MRRGYVALALPGLLGLLVGLGSSAVYAQRGVGKAQGVARQAVRPAVTTLTGEVVVVKTGPCENTTGRSPVGTHVLLKTPEGKTLNIHLGPAAAVKNVAEQLKAGQKISVEAFRTPNMPEDHYVAVTIKLDGKTMRLRDKTLRPVWVGRRQQDPSEAGTTWGRGWWRNVRVPSAPQWGGTRWSQWVPRNRWRGAYWWRYGVAPSEARAWGRGRLW